MFCIKCGNKLPDDAVFCTKCGSKVVIEEVTVDTKENIIKEAKTVETVDKQIQANDMKSSKAPLIVVFSILGGLIVIGVVLIILWLFVFNKGSNSEDLKPDNEEVKNPIEEETKKEEESKEEDTKEKTNVYINFYKMNDSDYILNYSSNGYSQNNYETSEYNKVGSYYCYSYNCKFKDGVFDKVLIFDDDKYILYDINKKTEEVINLDVDSSNDIRFYIDDNKIYGLQVSKNYKYAYYDLQTNKYLTDFKYSGFNSDGAIKFNKIIAYIYDDSIDGPYSKSDYYLINMKNGKVEMEEKGLSSFTARVLNNHLYYSKKVYSDYIESVGFDIYNEKLEKIADNIKHFGLMNNGNIMLENNNGFDIYNSKGELIKTSKQYTKVMLIVDNYVAVLDDGYLKLINSDEEEVAKFEWNDKMRFHEMLSGYYTDSNVKVHGIYLVVEDESIPDGTKGRGLEYYYGTETGETGVIELEYVGGYAKPVLYLYPEVETNIEVMFDNPNMLTTTYPKYINSWNVVAHPNGDLYSNGRYYYGLYWEEIKNHEIDFSTGFYVTKDEAIKFLEEKLQIIGLNMREANEFIMYWLPILENNEQSLVYFELTDERDAYSKLNIKPRPDSILRMSMHVKKVNEKIDIEEQVLPTFDRHGFSVVEWGGVIY